MTLLLFLIILGALIFVHELGHFISAKRAGIRVDEFALGFPPRLLSKKIGETEYTLNLVPFGGYVKIFGEDGEDTESPLPPEEDPPQAEPGGLSPTFSEKWGTGVVSPDPSRRFTSKSKWTQALVLSSGILGNLVFAWFLLSVGFMAGIPSSVEGRYASDVQEARLMITSVFPDSPAAKAGLKAGDEVARLADDKRRFEGGTADSAREFIASSEGPLSVSYARGGELLELSVTPSTNIVPGKPVIGVILDTVGVVRFGFFRSLFEGLLMTFDLVREVAGGLAGFIADAFRGAADFSAVTGPVGIAGLVGEARVLGFAYLLSFTAFISVNLAVINLLPIPALDGGRLLFLAIEGVARRAIPVRVTRTLNTLGFVLLILLMVAITYRDVARVISN